MAQLPSPWVENEYLWKRSENQDSKQKNPMISGVVLEFETFGASYCRASPCKQRYQLCAAARENSSFFMCDPTHGQGS